MGSVHSRESVRIAAPKAPREERGLRLGGSLPILGFPPPSRRGLILKARFNWTTGSCRSAMPALGTTVGRSEASKCAVVGSSGEVFSPFAPAVRVAMAAAPAADLDFSGDILISGRCFFGGVCGEPSTVPSVRSCQGLLA